MNRFFRLLSAVSSISSEQETPRRIGPQPSLVSSVRVALSRQCQTIIVVENCDDFRASDTEKLFQVSCLFIYDEFTFSKSEQGFFPALRRRFTCYLCQAKLAKAQRSMFELASMTFSRIKSFSRSNIWTSEWSLSHLFCNNEVSIYIACGPLCELMKHE